MIRVLIENGYRLTVPKELRRKLKVGDEILVSEDSAGRIVLLSEKRIRAALTHSSGLWRGRTDIPKNGIQYTNHLRRGRRLRRLGVTRHAAHRH